VPVRSGGLRLPGRAEQAREAHAEVLAEHHDLALGELAVADVDVDRLAARRSSWMTAPRPRRRISCTVMRVRPSSMDTGRVRSESRPSGISPPAAIGASNRRRGRTRRGRARAAGAIGWPLALAACTLATRASISAGFMGDEALRWMGA
jgi:hypothetical protein